MKRTKTFTNIMLLSLLILVAALAGAGTASAGISGSLPGRSCGSVGGATWKLQGQTGTRYDVYALPAGSCAVAMKAVAGLTKQTPRKGLLGPKTLIGPTGFHCAGSGIKPSHAGFCGGSGSARFFWAPRLTR